MFGKPVVRIVVAVASVVMVAAAVAPTQARAAGGCDAGPVSQPFLPWLDPAQYVLAPNGDFERGAADWQQDDGADVATGNETFFVGSGDDARALQLAPGGSATSRAFCISWNDPTLRFFVRKDGGPLSTLRVDVLYTGLLGDQESLALPALAGGDWAPTLPLPLAADLAVPPLLTDGNAQISLRFTAVGGGTWSVDDVYVDPFKTK